MNATEAKTNNIQRSVMHFHGYSVNLIHFSFNSDFKADNENGIPINPIFKRKITVDSSNIYSVTLMFELNPDVGDKDKDSLSLSISITGRFSLDENNENLISENAIAILFPYLRALISTVTANANIPPLVLPIINVTEMFNKDLNNDGK